MINHGESDSSVEPTEYFETLKSKLNKQEQSTLEKQISTIGLEIERAKKLNLKSVLHRLSFAYLSVLKEQTLLLKGVDIFVYREDILKFIEKVEPKNSIKICELSRYPRLIPEGPAERIAEIAELGIFDEMFVVYTDFTNQTIETKEEKAFVARNRDPIVFGAFRHEKLDFKHDRYYFVADWEDEYCDLTFTKMLEKMSDLGMKNIEHKISQDASYLNKVATDSLAEAEEASKDRYGESRIMKPKSWLTTLMEKIGF